MTFISWDPIPLAYPEPQSVLKAGHVDLKDG